VFCVNTPEVYVNDVFTISVQAEKGLTEYCHLLTVPTCPDKVSNPLVVPEQIVDPPATEPPVEAGETVTVAEVENAALHTPLEITALNCVV